MWFATLSAVSDKYYKDKVFQSQLQAMVLEQYKDKLLLVEEADYSPKDVPPGTPVTVQSIAEDDDDD
jgi:hypothetical protein